jgi:hypothetical protein
MVVFWLEAPAVSCQLTKAWGVAGETQGGVYRRREVGTLPVHFALCKLFDLTLLIAGRDDAAGLAAEIALGRYREQVKAGIEIFLLKFTPYDNNLWLI